MLRKTIIFLQCIFSIILLFQGCSIENQTTAGNNSVETSSVIKNSENMSIIDEQDEQDEQLQLYEVPDRDIEAFKIIQKFYPWFEYSKYYTNKDQYALQMYFDWGDSILYHDYFAVYEVFYNSIDRIATISYFAGKMDWGSLIYTIVDDDTVICVSKSYGVSGYRYEIEKNGEKITEEVKEYQD